MRVRMPTATATATSRTRAHSTSQRPRRPGRRTGGAGAGGVGWVGGGGGSVAVSRPDGAAWAAGAEGTAENSPAGAASRTHWYGGIAGSGSTSGTVTWANAELGPTSRTHRASRGLDNCDESGGSAATNYRG